MRQGTQLLGFPGTGASCSRIHLALALALWLPCACDSPSPGGASNADSPAARADGDVGPDDGAAPQQPAAEGTRASGDASGGSSSEAPPGNDSPLSASTRSPDDTGDAEETPTAVPEAPAELNEPVELSGEVAVDVEAGEVRIPCIFVNPNQALEVFACHWEGPAHESVVAFRARGEDIFLGLLELGLRPPDFWNATQRVAQGKPDVRYTLGDRALVVLRWERDGQRRELPAEKVLRETVSGFSPFVRGFTFSGEEVPMGDPPVRRVPSRVEITLGGPTRGERAVASILFHPHDLDALTRWMPVMELDPGVVPEVRELVESGTVCELVIKKVDGEAELLQLTRARETSDSRRALLEKLGPTARKIDAAKAEYRGAVERLLEIASKGSADDADPQAQKALLEEYQTIVRGARLEKLVLEIWGQYLELFLEQESYRLEQLESLDDVPADWLQRMRAYNERLRFESRLAAKEREILDVQGKEPPLSEADRLLSEALGFELDALRHESNLPLARVDLADTKGRQKELDPEEDAYSLQLVEEQAREIRAAQRFLRAKTGELRTRAAENRARAAGEWNDRREAILAERQKWERQIELANLEREFVSVLSDIRWAHNFIEDDRLPAERREEHAAKLETLREKKTELQAQIDALKETLGELSETSTE